MQTSFAIVMCWGFGSFSGDALYSLKQIIQKLLYKREFGIRIA